MINQTLWQAVFGREPAGIFVIVDPQVRQSYGQLRSLPLLLELGIERFTFISAWNTFPLVPYEYVLVNEDTSYVEMIEVFPVCQIVSQEIEDNSPAKVSKKLLMAHTDAGGDPLLVYVFDSDLFSLYDSSAPKSFVEEYEIPNRYAYDKVFASYLEAREGDTGPISMAKTLNLVLYQMARGLYLSTGLEQRKVRDLFDFDRLLPESPAWDLLEKLIPGDRQSRDDDYIHGQLRPWIDSDITATSRRILEMLQRHGYDVEKMQLRRRRSRDEG